MQYEAQFDNHRSPEDRINHFITVLNIRRDKSTATVAIDMPYGSAFIELDADRMDAFAEDLKRAANVIRGQKQAAA